MLALFLAGCDFCRFESASPRLQLARGCWQFWICSCNHWRFRNNPLRNLVIWLCSRRRSRWAVNSKIVEAFEIAVRVMDRCSFCWMVALRQSYWHHHQSAYFGPCRISFACSVYYLGCYFSNHCNFYWRLRGRSSRLRFCWFIIELRLRGRRSGPQVWPSNWTRNACSRRRSRFDGACSEWPGACYRGRRSAFAASGSFEIAGRGFDRIIHDHYLNNYYSSWIPCPIFDHVCDNFEETISACCGCLLVHSLIHRNRHHHFIIYLITVGSWLKRRNAVCNWLLDFEWEFVDSIGMSTTGGWRLFARALSTPWTLDSSQQSKFVP